jgi:hypothetical protein
VIKHLAVQLSINGRAHGAERIGKDHSAILSWKKKAPLCLSETDPRESREQ